MTQQPVERTLGTLLTDEPVKEEPSHATAHVRRSVHRHRSSLGLVRPPLETMPAVTSTARQKALSLNLDQRTYGTLAEIGAGQEVARWFFQVGGAAGTVAKSISAYDMVASDGLYGPAERYVSRQRPEAMLEHEFAQLVDGLGRIRGDTPDGSYMNHTAMHHDPQRR